MLKIYGANLSTPANKVRFVANVLGLEYEYKQVNLRSGEHRSEEFLKLHPAGKIPAIDDDGFICFESNAIIRYLSDKAGSGLYPKDIKKRAVVDQWMDFSSLHIGAAVNRVAFNRIFVRMLKQDADQQSLKDGLKFLDRFLPVVNDQLSSNTYLAGQDMSLADFVLLSALDPAEAADINMSSYISLVKWRKGLMSEEFYKRCHSSYENALKERMGAMSALKQ